MIINKELANKTIPTAYGEITFNDKGESHDLAEAHQKHLGEHVRGFTYVPGKARAEKKREEVRKEELENVLANDGKAEALTAGEDKAEAMIVDEDKAAAMNKDKEDKKSAEATTKARRKAPAKK